MLTMDVFLLSFIQGLTEFLPVSSSAHLVLLQNFLQNDFGLFFDISLHFGSILAVMLFYRKEVFKLIKSLFKPNYKALSVDRNLIGKLIVATIPLVVAGMFFYGVSEGEARDIKLIAINSIVFGILLFIADYFLPQKKHVGQITYKNALIIGLFQVFSLIPGVSRSGSTITASRFLKVNRVDAIQFSIFLSIPAIVGAMTLTVYKNIDTLVLDSNMMLGMVASFVFSYLALWLFVKFSKKFSFAVFAVYRIILGVLLLK